MNFLSQLFSTPPSPLATYFLILSLFPLAGIAYTFWSRRLKK